MPIPCGATDSVLVADVDKAPNKEMPMIPILWPIFHMLFGG
jgi:hypothetical protein